LAASRWTAVAVSDEIIGYVASASRRTRELPSVALGASPRAGVHLLAALGPSRGMAGRDFVVPDDVVALTGPVLAHRTDPDPRANSTAHGRGPWSNVLASGPDPSLTDSGRGTSMTMPAFTGHEHEPREDRAVHAAPYCLAALLVAFVAILSAVLPVPVSSFLLAGGIADAFSWISRGSIAGSLARPHAVADPVAARRRPVSCQGRRARPGASGPDSASRFLQSFLVEPPWAGGNELKGELTGRHRGIQVLPPVTVRAVGPLGLGSLDHSVGTARK